GPSLSRRGIVPTKGNAPCPHISECTPQPLHNLLKYDQNMAAIQTAILEIEYVVTANRQAAGHN
ncbi:MAG TPA: hypothetical protein VEC99_18200, partial [Clostridia bacterium]|nr:hypothetical protein [Clostridia bacterium]